ncbi:cyclic nucleotide-binding domain-containing protein [Cohnella sp. AR92]|uniref:cyclic nucleotide-binding domain-containing protein n=1 Tax=Cohnella sp. AR92 TaxID=648716 RepID=UPI00131566FE|nr:cyclic nucleotide-binding domain-containing protein [Cohnella sp. AR92]
MSELHAFILSLPFIREFSLEEAAALHRHIEAVTCEQEEYIVRRGEHSDACYFVYNGAIEIVSKDLIGLDTVVATLDRGRIFGDITLHRDTVRRTSARACKDASLLMINHASFGRIVSEAPSFYNQLIEFSLERQKTTYLRLASIFARLPEETLESLARRAAYLHFPDNWVVTREGVFGDHFYMVVTGTLRATRNGRPLETFQKGDFFGECSLILNQEEPFTVESTTNCEVLTISKRDFQAILQQQNLLPNQFEEIVRIRYADIMRSHPRAVLNTEMPEIESGKKRYHIGVLLAGLIGFAALAYASLGLGLNELLIPAIAVGSFVGPVAFVAYLHARSILTNRPFLLATMFAATAAGGIPIAYWLEELTSGLMDKSPYLNSALTALIEEPAKLIFVFWLLRLRRNRFLMDGIVYGAACGMGFAAFENILYGLNHLHDPGQALNVILFRALFAPFGHGTWTAIAAYGLWQLYVHNQKVVCALCVSLALALHALWDLQVLPSRSYLLQMLLIGALGLYSLQKIVRQGLRDERQSIIALNPELLNRGEEPVTYIDCSECSSTIPFGSHYCPRCGRAVHARENVSF